MKAKIIEQVHKAKNYGGEKETVSKYVVLAKTAQCNELREIVDCRVYMGRSRNSSTVYASIWVHAADFYTSGTGTAGGYGYHKESAAIQSAITSAGIELYGDVCGSDCQWNYEEKRENTPREIAAIKRRLDKRRAHIGGVVDSAIRSALEAIARAAGARAGNLFW